MDDIELKNIEPHLPLIRSLSRSDSCIQEDKIETDFGTVLVAVQGDRNKPSIFTYHDIGLNYVSQFQTFFNFIDTRILMQSFCIYHLNAPGQEEGAPTLPDNYTYPTMDQLAEAVLPILKFYGVKHFVGLGVGAGANILSRFALLHPDCVDGLFLINCCCTASSWSEWGYQKLNTMYLRSSGMTASTQDYLMWHHFGKVTEGRSQDLIQVYRQYFNKSVNAYNMSLFIDAFVRRSDLGIAREMDPQKKKSTLNFKCHVLLLAGALSPHLDSTVTMNSRLDPSNSTWMKLSDCGMVLEEEPTKVNEILRLFLQGLGYALNQFRRRSSTTPFNTEAAPLSHKKFFKRRQESLDEESAMKDKSMPQHIDDDNKAEVHIVENPINQHGATC